MHAVHSGHRYARELDAAPRSAAYRRDGPILPDPHCCTTMAPGNGIRHEYKSICRASGRPGADPALRAGTTRRRRLRWRRSASSAASGSARPRGGAAEAGRLPGARYSRRKHSAGAQSSTASCARSTMLPSPRLAAVPHRDVAMPGGRACRAVSSRGARFCVPIISGPTISMGTLIAAPHLTRCASFDKSTISLYPVGVESWGGFIFLHLTPAEAQPLAAQLGGIPQRIAALSARASCASAIRSRYEVAANWKVDLRELQRVLSLRRRASGAVRRGAGFSRGGRRGSRLDARRPASRRAPTLSHAAARPRGAPFPASTRTSGSGIRANSSIRTCS